MSLTPDELYLIEVDDYEIDNSVLQQGQQYLTYTPTRVGDLARVTIDCWLKVCGVKTKRIIMHAGPDDANNESVYLGEDDKIHYQLRSHGKDVAHYVTTKTLTDCSGHGHLIVTRDFSALAVLMYFNGQEISLSALLPLSSGTTGQLCGTAPHEIGAALSGYNGYISEPRLLDGVIALPRQLGRMSKSGQWIPRKYRGEYGKNGFLLEFKAAAELGRDTSGQTNHFTVAAGVQQTFDTPTNNLCVLSNDTPLKLTQGNLAAQGINGGYYDIAVGTINPWNGKKWAWGMRMISESGPANGRTSIGLISSNQTLTNRYLGLTDNCFGGLIMIEGVRAMRNNTYLTRVTINKTSGCRAVLLGDGAGKIWLAGISAKDNQLKFGAGVDPVTGSGAYNFTIPKDWLLAVHCYDASDRVEIDRELSDVSLPLGYTPVGPQNQNAVLN